MQNVEIMLIDELYDENVKNVHKIGLKSGVTGKEVCDMVVKELG